MNLYDDPKNYGKGPLRPSFALKIKNISDVVDGYATITPEEDQEITDPIIVPDSFIEKYNPAIGGFFILCDGGTALYSEG